MIEKLKDKKVIITGGSKGIGRAIALAFAQEGANIVITYNSDLQAAKAVVDEIQRLNVQVKAIQFHIQNEEDHSRLLIESTEFLGDIDILVNNAGFVNRQKFLEISPEDIKNIFYVNCIGPVCLSQAVANYMIKQQTDLTNANKAFTDRCIINITSISRNVATGLPLYEMSKAALSQMSPSVILDPDFIKFKIRVNDVAPGLIPTSLNRNQWETHSDVWQNRINAIPLGRPGQPEEVAAEVIAIAKSSWKTGTTSTIDGGRSANWLGIEIDSRR